MKHFRWAPVAVLVMAGALFLHSCNEDIPYSSGVIALKTASLYDGLGITGPMTEALAKGDNIIVGDILIYDKEGRMVYGKELETTVLSPLLIEVNDLENGEYTVVAIQTACTRSRAVDWEIKDEEDLRTVALMALDESAHDFAAAVGYAAATLTLKGGIFELELSPEPMGSVVDIQIDHLTAESGYSFMTLGYDPTYFYAGFYLDPARSDDDRWVVLREPYRYSLILGFASPDEPAGKYFTLCHGDSVPLSLTGFSSEAGKEVASGNYSLPVGGYFFYYLDLNDCF